MRLHRVSQSNRRELMISWLLQKSISLVPWSLRENIRKQPILASAQRALLRRFLADRKFVHVVDAGPARGLKCLVELPADKGIWTGTYERSFALAMSEAIAPGDVCYDIGGWRGYFSGVMALAKAGQVIVFEPLPNNADRVRGIIDLNPNLPIRLFDCAIGESNGKAKLLVMPQSSMAKLTTSLFETTQREIGSVEVDVATLDSLIERNVIPPPALVKIDVEGAELSVLRGFSRSLEHHRPALFLEIHSRKLAKLCQDFLAARGYRLRVLETGNPPDFESEPDVCHFVADAEPELHPGERVRELRAAGASRSNSKRDPCH